MTAIVINLESIAHFTRERFYDLCLADAAWLKLERWETLTPKQRIGFPPICPDFVVELRSTSDRLKPLQAKMQEYVENGLQLGWLIDPQNQQVEIDRSK
jgi:Uma2 family endonuclease